MAAGSVPAVHARSGGVTKAAAVAPTPRRDPLARLRQAYQARGPAIGTHQMGTAGRDTVRGASVVTRRGPPMAPRGIDNAAGLEDEVAGAGLTAHERQRLGTGADTMVKEPSTARGCTVLLGDLRSSSSSPSVGSSSSWRAEWTIEVVMTDLGCPRLGTHTPSASGQEVTGAPCGVRGRAGAAGQRVAPCALAKGTLAPWPFPRRGCRNARREHDEHHGNYADGEPPCTHAAPAAISNVCPPTIALEHPGSTGHTLLPTSP
jgi:hypothetical protein